MAASSCGEAPLPCRRRRGRHMIPLVGQRCPQPSRSPQVSGSHEVIPGLHAVSPFVLAPYSKCSKAESPGLRNKHCRGDAHVQSHLRHSRCPARRRRPAVSEPTRPHALPALQETERQPSLGRVRGMPQAEQRLLGRIAPADGASPGTPSAGIPRSREAVTRGADGGHRCLASGRGIAPPRQVCYRRNTRQWWARCRGAAASRITDEYGTPLRVARM